MPIQVVTMTLNYVYKPIPNSKSQIFRSAIHFVIHFQNWKSHLLQKWNQFSLNNIHIWNFNVYAVANETHNNWKFRSWKFGFSHNNATLNNVVFSFDSSIALIIQLGRVTGNITSFLIDFLSCFDCFNRGGRFGWHRFIPNRFLIVFWLV